MTPRSNGLHTRNLEMLDRPEVSRVLFHPRRDHPHLPLSPRACGLRIPIEEGIAVSGRLHQAKPDGPTILFFHGNGEIASDYDGISSLYSNLGINLLVVDYRGYGSSDGQPSASHLPTDAATVYKETGAILVEHGLRAKPLFIMGRSLGSAAAIAVAQQAGDEVAGLIIESGFAYTLPLLTRLGLRRELAGADEERDGLGHLDKIAQINVPTLIIHGQADQLIPVENGCELYEHSGAAVKRLVTIPHAGHNDLLFTGHRPYLEALQAFVLGIDT